MQDRIRTLVLNFRFGAAAHWAVFALGLVSLLVSIGAAAAS